MSRQSHNIIRPCVINDLRKHDIVNISRNDVIDNNIHINIILSNGTFLISI